MDEPLTCGRCGDEITGTTCETCADRRVNASIAANARWSREPSRARATAAARAAGPGSIDYWISRVEGGERMTPADRIRAAENLRSEFYQRLAKQGRAARKANRARKKTA